jgi:hypothetical protein
VGTGASQDIVVMSLNTNLMERGIFNVHKMIGGDFSFCLYRLIVGKPCFANVNQLIIQNVGA